MRKTILFVIFTLLLGITIIPVLANPPSDTSTSNYNFSFRYTTVSSSTADLTNIWSPLIWNFSELVSRGFIQSDGDDLLSNIGSTFTESSAQEPSSTDVTLWQKIPSLPATSSVTITNYTGNSSVTHDYPLGLLSTDSAEVPDAASLDVTSRLTIEALDVTLDTIPTAETWLLNKDCVYGLGVRSTNELFGYITSNNLDATDETVNANDGAVTGAVLTNDGALCQAADFDGTDDNINFASGASIDDIFTGGGTVEFYARMAADGVSDALIDKGSGTGAGWRITRLNDNLIHFTVAFDGASDGNWAVDATFTVVDGWTRWSITYDDGAVANNPIIYRDGVSVAFTETSTPIGSYQTDAAANLIAGETDAGANDFDGGLDDIRLWDDIRTVTEIADNDDVELVGTEANLQGYWKLNGEYVEVSSATLVAGTEFDAQLIYHDATNLFLYIDDVICAAPCAGVTATTVTINTNTNVVDIGPFSGEVHQSLVMDGNITVTDLSSTGQNITDNVNYVTILDSGYTQFGTANYQNNGFRIIAGAPAASDNIFDSGGTVEWCSKPVDADNNDTILSRRGPGWDVDFINSSIHFTFDWTLSDGSWRAANNTALDREMHCWAISYNADAAANDPILYKDGVVLAWAGQDLNPTGTRDSDAGASLFIGSNNSGGENWEGLIDEVRLWNDIRTATEILDNVLIELVGTEAGLVQYYQFENPRVLDFTYEPDTIAETAKGVTPTWTWTGTIADQSAEVNNGTYEYIRTYVASLQQSFVSSITVLNPLLEDVAGGDPGSPIGLGGVTDPTGVGSVSPSFPFYDLLVTNTDSTGFADIMGISVAAVGIILIAGIAYLLVIAICRFMPEAPIICYSILITAFILGAVANLYEPLYAIILSVMMLGMYAANRLTRSGSA